MTQSCSFVHSGREFVEQTAKLVWQTETFLELWGRVLVNPSSCFVNAGECSVRKINLSSCSLSMQQQLYRSDWMVELLLRYSWWAGNLCWLRAVQVAHGIIHYTARDVWPESARMLRWSWRTPKCLQIRFVHWRCRAQNARRYRV